MIDKLIEELLYKLPVDGHPGGPTYQEWADEREKLIREYMEKAFDEGEARGKEKESNYWEP